MGCAAFAELCRCTVRIQGHLNYMMTLTPELRAITTRWVMDAVRGPSYEAGKDIRDFHVREITQEMVDSIPPGVDARMATFLLIYTPDHTPDRREVLDRGYQAYEAKVRYILSNPSLCSSDLRHGEHWIINGVYHYKLHATILGSDLASFLLEKGYKASFHNTVSRSAKVCIPIFDRVSNRTKSLANGEDKIEAHRFTIHSSGSVLQTSPTRFDEALKAYNTIMTEIKEFLGAESVSVRSDLSEEELSETPEHEELIDE